MVERVFIIGVQRCGTTLLYHLLDEHPDIVMAKPVRPEPKVFLGDSLTGDARSYDALLFPDDPPSQVRGEKSTSYLEYDDALRRMSITFPQAKVMVVLRDPVRRALSHYQFSVVNGLEQRSIDEALSQDLKGQHTGHDRSISVSPYAYVQRGRYLEQLQRLERFVAKSDLQIVIFEDLLRGRITPSEIYHLVGVSGTARRGLQGLPTNASRSAENASPSLINMLRSYFAPLNAALEHHLGRELPFWQ